ncbi:ketoacyl-synthetase C-terminal extension domain-containing protein, partial [Paenibacillus glucanolyticus]|uniref:acyl carrier protein n=1 Tax=Paenibacillus glucanolyticus TaxID=59843 RepID=UPI003D006C90
IEGLMNAFGSSPHDRQFCSLGSVKSNIGHAESAAGVIGLQKAALQIYHKTLVPSLHAEELNPYIDFEQSPFYVQRVTEEWQPSVMMEDGRQVRYPRRAALSSFGATGSNAHVILEEYIDTQIRGVARTKREQDRPVLVPLSAKNNERLKSYAVELLKHLQGLPIREKVLDIEHTESQLAGFLEERIRGILAAIIHVDGELIEASVPWSEYGVEPVHIRQLKDKILEEFAVEMDDREWVQSCTIASVAAHLLDEHPERLRAQSEVAAHDETIAQEEWELTASNLHKDNL